MHAHVAEGRQRVEAASRYLRHRHEGAYAAVVLFGGYEEAGERGRWCPRAGDVVIHDMFDAHCDRFGGACEILNLHLPADRVPAFAFGRVRDPDRVAALAERDARAAMEHLLASLVPREACGGDWQDELVAELWRRPVVRLSEWAASRGVSAEHVSRTFARTWGVTPSCFRAGVRARKAWRAAVSGITPLAAVAAECGFSDQAHMTRAVRAITGRTPGYWRSKPFGTETAMWR